MKTVKNSTNSPQEALKEKEVILSPKNEVLVEMEESGTMEENRNFYGGEEFNKISGLAKEFQGKTLSIFGATPLGGGVAYMRHPLVRLLKMLGVSVHWYVLRPDPNFFEITKKIHNIFQNIALQDIRLTEEDKTIYNNKLEQDANFFSQAEVFKESDIVLIDDPQPAGLIQYILADNSNAKIIYRSHIQTESDLISMQGSPQNEVWNFIWQKIQKSDRFIFHPVKEFVPDDVPRNKLVFSPPSTDPFDGLNRELSEKQIQDYLDQFDILLINEDQHPLDRKRPYVIQIARFDPSKGITDVIESYLKLRKKLEDKGEEIPQLVITGNGSVDDPDGPRVLAATKQLLKNRLYSDYSDDIKVIRPPHINELMNALLRKSKISLQLSHKEGWEFKITEALMKGIPVVVYNVGGMPQQVLNGIDGYVVNAYDTTAVADKMYELFVNHENYLKMAEAAKKHYRKDCLTLYNAHRILSVANELVK